MGGSSCDPGSLHRWPKLRGSRMQKSEKIREVAKGFGRSGIVRT